VAELRLVRSVHMRASFALAVLLLGRCASPPRVVLEPHASTMPRDPLDIRFVRVDIDRVPLLSASKALSTEIRNVYGERLAPDVAYTAGPFPGVPERRVTVHATDVSFRQLMDEFCRQTDWHYRVNGLGWIEFQSGPVPDITQRFDAQDLAPMKGVKGKF